MAEEDYVARSVFSDDDAPHYVVPTPEELKARNKRNVYMALGLAGFMIFVFFSLLSRSGAI